MDGEFGGGLRFGMGVGMGVRVSNVRNNKDFICATFRGDFGR